MSNKHDILHDYTGTLPPGIKAMFYPAEQDMADTPIAATVIELERHCTEAKRLLQEIIASLNLEGNAQWFSDMPEGWFDLVGNWTKRYRELVSTAE